MTHHTAAEAAFWATYNTALNHAASCPACRGRRNQDGVSQGLCPEGDQLIQEHRRARRRTRTAEGTT